MPLTAYSTSYEKEGDVDQFLHLLSKQFGENASSADNIPDTWRAHLRGDLQCPSCFVSGAEVVREVPSTKTGRANRQSFFRFTTPGHHPHCDFATAETANTVPENLVSFGESRSNLTRVVRELVCTGIERGVFSQRSIRDMREWFFNRKIESLFVVTLDPRFPKWIDGLQRAYFLASNALPGGVSLTPQIAAMPDFDWRAEAARQLLNRYPQRAQIVEAFLRQTIPFFGEAERVESLARRFQGRPVFDPSALADEYNKTRTLADFIGHNYAPLKEAKPAGPASASVLAFSALLLFIRGWDVSLAISEFVRIAAAAGYSNQELGNVMGLNPFHDYQAWRVLKQVQDLNVAVPQNTDIRAEREAIEAEIRSQFGIPSASTKP